MKKLNHFFVIWLFMLIGMVATAQKPAEVIGKIVDSQGEEAIGATILVKGTQTGTVADYNGNYKITVPDNQQSVLVFSFVGMETKEIRVNGQSVINVVLEQGAVMLNEVVSIGYGTMRRRDITGSVASVDTKELEKVPVSSVAQALSGRISGVNVTSSEGSLDAQVSIRIRGGMSITQGNSALYIIDGFPSEESSFNALNASDIETIDVLKDASSTAIYGSRGANGVIVVTTKGGKEGTVNISYQGYYGVRSIAKKLDVLNAEEFILLDYERRSNDAASLSRFNTNFGEFQDINANFANTGVNWQDEVFRDAFSKSHQINVTGGVNRMNYSASFSHQEEDGLMVESGMQKNNLRFRLHHRLTNRVRFNANMNYNEQKTFGMGTSEGSANFGKMSHIIMYNPTLGFLASDEELLTNPRVNNLILDDDGNTMQNPVISAQYETNERELRIVNGGGSLEIEIFKNFKFNSNNGFLYRIQRSNIFNGSESMNAKRTSINGNVRSAEVGRFSTSNVFTYNWRKRQHKLDIMAGQEYVETWNRSLSLSATNFPNDDIGLNDFSLGLPGTLGSYFNDDDKLLSFFTRAYYNLSDKYMFTVSARLDGSSKFGANNKWGLFPSASVAWRASEEEFIKHWGIFSDLKVRLGYGAAGNNNIPSYQSLGLWNSVNTPYQNGIVPGYVLTQLPNENLSWETNTTFNFGLDFGFFEQRLVITPELYLNRSKDLLLRSKMPLSSGFEYMYQNIGSTENKGVDLTINSVNVNNKDFRWTSTLTLSHNNNKIVSLSGEQSYLETSGWGYRQSDYLVAVGQSIGLIYGFKTLGLYQTDDFVTETDEFGKSVFKMDGNKYILKDGVVSRSNVDVKPGYWKFADTDDENVGVIDDNDRQVIGNATPIFHGGFNNTFVYKSFDLSVFMNFSYGNDVLNATKLYTSLFGWSNRNTQSLNNANHRWVTIDNSGNHLVTPDEMNSINTGKTVAQWDDMENGDQVIHSWGVEDGSFLRIANVSFGYTLPKNLSKKIFAENLRIYASANNLHTFTKYTGFDPEVSTRNSTGTTPGVDWGAHPRSTSYVFGLNITF
jgi:TonB-dependent starch-binding outer membrane protein SusC